MDGRRRTVRGLGDGSVLWVLLVRRCWIGIGRLLQDLLFFAVVARRILLYAESIACRTVLIRQHISAQLSKHHN
jgi:hypothetical protein